MYDLDCWRDIKLTSSAPFLYELGNLCYYKGRVMRKPTFCLYKCENEVADQMRGTCNCAADRRLCLRYRDKINTSVSHPEDSFFLQGGSYSIIMVSNHFKRAYQLAASVWGCESLVGLSPNYTVKLCFMKLKSFIKFDHVAGLKISFHGPFWSFMKHIFGYFSIEHVLFHTTCSPYINDFLTFDQ